MCILMYIVDDRARHLLTSTPVRVSKSLQHDGKLPGKVQFVIKYFTQQSNNEYCASMSGP